MGIKANYEINNIKITKVQNQCWPIKTHTFGHLKTFGLDSIFAGHRNRPSDAIEVWFKTNLQTSLSPKWLHPNRKANQFHSKSQSIIIEQQTRADERSPNGVHTHTHTAVSLEGEFARHSPPSSRSCVALSWDDTSLYDSKAKVIVSRASLKIKQL